ncbi:hypothetical protein HRbin15_02051 [bacterium HR15]|nr:hypothetical protein HRbin15_02051 [bacterium HR15]
MRRTSGIIGLALLLMVGNTQTFTHQRIGQGFIELGFGILTSNGIPIWSGVLNTGPDQDIFRVTSWNNFTAAVLGSDRVANPIAVGPNGELMWEGTGTATGGTFDVFVENTNISAAVLGNNRSAFGFRFTSTGQPVWYGAGDNTGGFLDIFVGSTNITASVLGNNRDAYPASLNASDQLLWDGTGDNIGSNRDVFRTDLATLSTTNVSQSVLGSSRFAVAVEITDSGNMLWHGGGSNTGGNVDVFRNAVNISLSALGSGIRDATAFDMDGINVLWQGRSSATGNFFDTFVNSTNLSSGVLGANRDSLPILLRGNYALWEGLGANTNYNYDVLVSQLSPALVRNPSVAAFGNTAANTRESSGYAVFEDGNTVWVGKHTTATAGKHNLFYYRWSSNSNINLTQQALGRNAESVVMAVNSQRQILWAARNAADTEWEIWLTTENVPTTLQGTVSIAGYVGTANPIVLTFQLIDPYTGSVAQTTNATVNPSGNYSANVANAGLWRVRVKAPRVLARAFGAMGIVGPTTLNFSMTPGDVNDDNTIDDADLLQVLFAFGSSDAGADVNGDGTVDDADLLLVLFNFGASGE